MGTLMKQRSNQHGKFVEDYDDDEDDNDGGVLIFENTQYVNLLYLFFIIKMINLKLYNLYCKIIFIL